MHYQQQLRAEALERRDKKTLASWDRLLAPIQNVPKDWVRWVDKVAIEENYIFYDYRKGGGPGRVYGKTLPGLVAGNAKETGLVEWIRANNCRTSPAAYMNALQAMPQLEQMVKAGLNGLANECYAHPSTFENVIKYPQESKLTRALGINTQELKRLRALNGNSLILKWLQWGKASGRPIPDETLAWYTEQELEPRSFNSYGIR